MLCLTDTLAASLRESGQVCAIQCATLCVFSLDASSPLHMCLPRAAPTSVQTIATSIDIYEHRFGIVHGLAQRVRTTFARLGKLPAAAVRASRCPSQSRRRSGYKCSVAPWRLLQTWPHESEPNGGGVARAYPPALNSIYRCEVALKRACDFAVVWTKPAASHSCCANIGASLVLNVRFSTGS